MVRTLKEVLVEDREISEELYELWTSEGVCVGRRYRGELRSELTEGLGIGGQRETGTNGSYIMRVK